MPVVRAEHLCPSAVFLPPDFPRYRAVSRQVREICRRHTDLIEPLSLTLFGFTTTYKTAGTVEMPVSRTRHEDLWVGCGLDLAPKRRGFNCLVY